MALVERLNGAAARPVQGRGGNFKPLVERRQEQAGSISLTDGDFNQNMSHLAAAIDAGAAVMLSKTSDGGAISITLYKGQDRWRVYAKDAGELAEAFEALSATSMLK